MLLATNLHRVSFSIDLFSGLSVQLHMLFVVVGDIFESILFISGVLTPELKEKPAFVAASCSS